MFKKLSTRNIEYSNNSYNVLYTACATKHTCQWNTAECSSQDECSSCVGGDYGGSGFEVAGSQPHRVLHNGGGRWREATDRPG